MLQQNRGKNKRISRMFGLFIVLGGVIALFFAAACNSRDNRNSPKKAEMKKLTLEWGRFAPFPPSAKNFQIRTEGSSFTRTFIAQFHADSSAIENWIQDSPGLREATTEKINDGKYNYTISPGEGACCAKAIIDFKNGSVVVEVSWS
jgi:hypothetical protein